MVWQCKYKKEKGEEDRAYFGWTSAGRENGPMEMFAKYVYESIDDTHVKCLLKMSVVRKTARKI